MSVLSLVTLLLLCYTLGLLYGVEAGGDFPNCKSWLTKHPEQCGSAQATKMCPTYSKTNCKKKSRNRSDPNKGSQRSSRTRQSNTKAESETDRQRPRRTRKKKTRRTGSEDTSAEKERDKQEREKSADKKSAERNREKDKSKKKKKNKKASLDDKEKQLKDCCKQQKLPKDCMEMCTFKKKIDKKKMACEKPDCIAEMKILVYCASNGQDNRECCKSNGVKDKKCLAFCDGSHDLPSVNEMFGSIKTAVKYQPCLKANSKIFSCHKEEHDGEKEWKKRKWKKEKLPDLIKSLAASQC